jgi:hypothetical protein
MLDIFFGSKIRVKILQLFYLNPDNPYYLRQLTKDLGWPINSVRLELKKLEASGLLKVSSDKGDKRLYSLNTDFLLYSEIRALILKSQILAAQKLAVNLLKDGHIKLLILSGHFTGCFHLPTDLLVVGRIKKSSFVSAIKKMEQDLGREVNYTLLDEKEWFYRRQISDLFINQLLINNKIVLINDLGIVFPEVANRPIL